MYELYTQIFKCWNGRQLVFTLREGTADFNSIQASVVEDEYALKTFIFEDGDVVIDIGSETGGEAVTLATLGRALNLYSFEPIPENFELLKVNMMNNNAFGIRPFKLAVGGQNNKVKIYYGAMDSESGRHHHFIGNALRVPKGNSIVVDMVTLEKIFKDNKIERCKLLKLDPEGEEFNILNSCPREILSKIDWIVGEHHNILRSKLLEACKGLFVDVFCPWQDSQTLGHFRFKNKLLK